ncbi:hypothetical protein [Variovorax paradoxus]|uniref:hypothetical protein n=1 Tax=Variovorax paradoxus TaxID=34073 RepID=UPI002783EB22|nr:hypothetical protein [Variovorax paradoxus]MDQ0591006.1 hypothetical protein [Variovorax paradoxus]
MRRTIANLIEATRLNFGAHAAPSLVSALNSPDRCLANHFSQKPANTRLKELRTMLFTPSPLAQDNLSPAEIDNICVVFTDGSVQRAAARLNLTRQRVAEVAGYRSAIAEAVAAAGDVGGVTPEQIVAVLAGLIGAADEELAAVREDHAAHDASRKGRRDQLAPLTSAVTAMQNRLAVERDSLLHRLDAAARLVNGPGDAIRQRYSMLVASGLKAEEINGLGAYDPSEDARDKQAAMRIRFDEVTAMLDKCRAYSDDPRRSVVHLDGLGFDALIAATYPERAAEVPA